MHKNQEKLLQLARKMDIGTMSKRKLSNLIGEKHPQTVIYHLEKLKKLGFIRGDISDGPIQAVDINQDNQDGSNIISIPVVGAASSGVASATAVEHIESFLKVSPSMVKNIKIYGLCAVRAIGNSLNQAKNITGGPIEEGDYVLVDTFNREPRNGEYVLSVMDGSANMKKFFRDETTGQIVLVSESTDSIPPIYVAEEDFADYMVNGVIKKVIKKSKYE